MSRSGYSDDCDGWDLIRWRGAVTSAIRGHRGQAFLRELLAALDALEDKRLIADHLEYEGAYCALGVVGAARGVNVQDIDPYDADRVAETFDIARALAKEIAFINDDDDWYCANRESDEHRFKRVRAWVAEQIIEGTDGS